MQESSLVTRSDWLFSIMSVSRSNPSGVALKFSPTSSDKIDVAEALRSLAALTAHLRKAEDKERSDEGKL